MEEISTHFLDNLIEDLQGKREAYEEAKKKSSALYSALQEHERKVMNTLQSAGKLKYYAEGVGTVNLINKLTVRTPKTIEDKQKLFDYIEQAHGNDLRWEMITVNHTSLNSFFKNEKEGKPADFRLPGIPEIDMVTELRFTKEKK